jgi:hypothetical protein
LDVYVYIHLLKHGPISFIIRSKTLSTRPNLIHACVSLSSWPLSLSFTKGGLAIVAMRHWSQVPLQSPIQSASGPSLSLSSVSLMCVITKRFSSQIVWSFLQCVTDAIHLFLHASHNVSWSQFLVIWCEELFFFFCWETPAALRWWRWWPSMFQIHIRVQASEKFRGAPNAFELIKNKMRWID